MSNTAHPLTGLEKEEGVEIVGVVQGVKGRDLRQAPDRIAYLPVDQQEDFGTALYVRAAGQPEVVMTQVREALKEFRASFIVFSVASIEEQVDAGLQRERLLAKLLSFFGGLALVLAAVRLYGVMSYAVVRRTGEIGIRMALGARRFDVLRMVLRETLVLVAAGVVLGIPAALATTRYLASLLFGLTPTDPATIVVLSVAMLAVAFLAGYVPARRASRVDPLIALRYE